MHPQGLQDEVHVEQETLQTVKALCRNTQETVEMLEDRKTQLKEELKIIFDLQKQEREVVSKLKIWFLQQDVCCCSRFITGWCISIASDSVASSLCLIEYKAAFWIMGKVMLVGRPAKRALQQSSLEMPRNELKSCSVYALNVSSVTESPRLLKLEDWLIIDCTINTLS